MYRKKIALLMAAAMTLTTVPWTASAEEPFAEGTVSAVAEAEAAVAQDVLSVQEDTYEAELPESLASGEEAREDEILEEVLSENMAETAGYGEPDDTANAPSGNAESIFDGAEIVVEDISEVTDAEVAETFDGIAPIANADMPADESGYEKLESGEWSDYYDAGATAYFSFTPPETGSYTIVAEQDLFTVECYDGDTELPGENGTQPATSNRFELAGGKTYHFRVGVCSEWETCFLITPPLELNRVDAPFGVNSPGFGSHKFAREELNDAALQNLLDTMNLSLTYGDDYALGWTIPWSGSDPFGNVAHTALYAADENFKPVGDEIKVGDITVGNYVLAARMGRLNEDGTFVPYEGLDTIYDCITVYDSVSGTIVGAAESYDALTAWIKLPQIQATVKYDGTPEELLRSDSLDRYGEDQICVMYLNDSSYFMALYDEDGKMVDFPSKQTMRQLPVPGKYTLRLEFEDNEGELTELDKQDITITKAPAGEPLPAGEITLDMENEPECYELGKYDDKDQLLTIQCSSGMASVTLYEKTADGSYSFCDTCLLDEFEDNGPTSDHFLVQAGREYMLVINKGDSYNAFSCTVSAADKPELLDAKLSGLNGKTFSSVSGVLDICCEAAVLTYPGGAETGKYWDYILFKDENGGSWSGYSGTTSNEDKVELHLKKDGTYCDFDDYVYKYWMEGTYTLLLYVNGEKRDEATFTVDNTGVFDQLSVDETYHGTLGPEQDQYNKYLSFAPQVSGKYTFHYSTGDGLSAELYNADFKYVDPDSGDYGYVSGDVETLYTLEGGKKYYLNIDGGDEYTLGDQMTFELTVTLAETTHEHVKDDGTVTKDATCTEAGEMTYKCKDCGQIMAKEPIPATGHTKIVDEEKSKAATCTEPGETVYKCSKCGEALPDATETVPATGHTKVVDEEKSTAATCTESGEMVYKCGKCGEPLPDETEIVPATGHTKVVDKEKSKAATCTEPGVAVYKCDVCGVAIGSPETVKATGHSWNAWTTVSEATVFAPEKQQRTCGGCGATETQDVGSKLAPKAEVPATKATVKTGQSTSVFNVEMAAGDRIVSVESSNTKRLKVASFNKTTGKLKLKAGKKTGKVKVTVTLASGEKRTITLTVQKKKVTTKSVKVTKKVSLKKGGKYTLKPVITPITTQDKVKFATSDKKVATVTSKGVVTAKKKGKATITVTCGKKKATCKITVTN